MLYQQVLDPKFREPYGNLNRWFVTCINQPEFKKLLGDIKLCETMAQFDNKKYQEYHPKDQKKGKGAEKKAAPKKEQPKKETPKKVEKEEEPPAPKEKKDPYADFPKPSMNLDEWKRTWSNKSLEESTNGSGRISTKRTTLFGSENTKIQHTSKDRWTSCSVILQGVCCNDWRDFVRTCSV